MRSSFEQTRTKQATRSVILPHYGDDDVRAAASTADDGASVLIARDRKFLLLNPTEGAAQELSHSRTAAVRLQRTFDILEKQLASTPATIARPGSSAPLGVAAGASIAVLCVGAVVGMLASIFILSDYALASPNDVVGNSRLTALVFSTLPSLSAIGLKEFRKTLLNQNSRWLFDAVVFGVGMTSLLAWLGAAAVTFAPGSGAAAALLTVESSIPFAGIALVVTTILCDVTLGCTLLSGVERTLSASQAASEVSNPAHRTLARELRQLKRLIDAAHSNAAGAQEYLDAVAAGRELIREEAQADLKRARELWTEAQSAARAFATAVFQSRTENSHEA